MPIETAPRDGSRVLLGNAFSDSDDWPQGARWRDGAWWHDYSSHQFAKAGVGSPTHWTVVPPPPAAHEQIEG